MKYQNIREEELKNKVGQDFFSDFDTTKIVGNIDFCVTFKNKNTNQEKLFENHSLLWAEAKRGTYDVLTMITQLVLTIGKARTFDKYMPPAFLGAFDSSKMGFVTYNAIIDVFSMNDFNWNVAPSNHQTKEFILIKERIEKSLHQNHYVYDFIKDEKELQFFIKNNITKTTENAKITIDKNNFVAIYLRWLEQVKPHIDLDWDAVKKNNIFDREFYLADLFVDDKGTSTIDDDTPLSENIFVVFKNGHYEILNKNLDGMFQSGSNTFAIKNKEAYEQFWKRYKRPPLEKFQQYILERKDLLVSQDIRERRGAFFTPQKWVALSQQYIADFLGEDWQEEYYIWDCAAGTGNLLAGLTNEYNIWASTLEMADVNVMHERIDNGAKLLKNHCFQFDFLNDDFTKLPQGLQDIINDEEKRKKLVIYINPPYAESNGKVSINRSNIQQSKTYTKYYDKLDKVAPELFAQFLARIYFEIPESFIAEFSTLKVISASNSKVFRNNFLAKLEKLFVVPANTFDNVKGVFPIGFFVWNTSLKEKFNDILADVYDEDGILINSKNIYSYDNQKGRINDWLKTFKINNSKYYSVLMADAPDFQNNNYISFMNNIGKRHGIYFLINESNLIPATIYLSVRHCIDATWLNDRDQFLYPNDDWQNDLEFHNDCFTFAMFHSQNKISSNGGTNHWIPFTEQELNAREKFESNFMTQFIKGKINQEQTVDLFSSSVDILTQEESHKKNNTQCDSSLVGISNINKPLEFSEKANNVFNVARELWKYYHAQKFSSNGGMYEGRGEYNVNASLYDIREHFQGRNDAGKMNNKSADEQYMKLITKLRENLKILAKKIEPKVYEYGFLKE